MPPPSSSTPLATQPPGMLLPVSGKGKLAISLHGAQSLHSTGLPS